MRRDVIIRRYMNIGYIPLDGTDVSDSDKFYHLKDWVWVNVKVTIGRDMTNYTKYRGGYAKFRSKRCPSHAIFFCRSCFARCNI